MEQSKLWHKSKTMWLGIGTMLAGILTGAMEFLPMLQLSIDPVTYSIILFSLGVVSMSLRIVTTSPLLLREEGEGNV